MQVELIDYTGKESADPWYAARLLVYTKNTRLEQGADTRAKVNAMGAATLEEELRYIATTIRSSWEFVDYTFEIKGVTRAFTHQLVRTRTASYAQQAQRVVDMRGFNCTLPASVLDNPTALGAWRNAIMSIQNAYAAMVENGIPAQDARGVLPTNVHTNIIAKMNLRTMADLVAKRENLRAQGEYAEVARAMAKLAMKTMPWTKDFLYPERTATPALDALLKATLGNRSPIDAPELNKALKELDALKGTWG
jgi:flavin-dependent thymidylate synthase